MAMHMPGEKTVKAVLRADLSHKQGAAFSVQPGDVIDGRRDGMTFDTLDLISSNPLRVSFDEGSYVNGTVYLQDSDSNEYTSFRFVNLEHVTGHGVPAPLACFTPGTRIATPKGERRVEDLCPGDKVVTRDNGVQEIRWIGIRRVTDEIMNLNPHLRPVLVQKGALGNGLPECDIMVSPNHRMLVSNDQTLLHFDEKEVLVAAKHLINNKGISAINTGGIYYVHFLCDQHEVVLSNGCWSESFLPSTNSLKGIGNAQRNEIFEVFPELHFLEGLETYGSARKVISRDELHLLAS